VAETSLPLKAAPVLVIEGEDATRRTIEGALKQQGYEVVVGLTAAEGLELAAATAMEAVVFSDRPPALDAVAFLSALGERGLGTPVVVTSSATGMVRAVEALRAGAVDYLRKPFGPKSVTEAVVRAGAVVKRRRQRELEGAPHVDLGIPAPLPAPPGPRRGTRNMHPALAAIADGLANQTIEVPAVPTVVTELRKAIRGQRSSLDDVARLIQRDQGLALDVLKIANSVIYARGARTSDLKVAVSRIGLVQLEGLIEAVFLRGCYQPRQPLFKTLLSELWKYSVCMAIAMRMLAENMPGPSRLDLGVAYVAGLLCDVGAAFLLWLVSERAPELSMELFIPFVRERHEPLGGQLLGAMGLETAVVQLAAHHHSQSPPTGVSLYWSLAAVASELTDRTMAGGDLTRGPRRAAAFVGQCADTLRISETTLRKVADQLEDELRGILEALS
jgi:HD-like signal output (HDOD) protein/ActR/RegA family two-component response regulator